MAETLRRLQWRQRRWWRLNDDGDGGLPGQTRAIESVQLRRGVRTGAEHRPQFRCSRKAAADRFEKLKRGCGHDNRHAHMADRRRGDDASRIRIVRELWQFDATRLAAGEESRRDTERVGARLELFLS